jgi:TolB protein
MTSPRRLATALAAFLLAASAHADREPVLKQIRLPHRYYFREMYLPQATSGPTSPAWAPDGKMLAVSMQGSLWTIDPASGRARQLTDGPGYDYQPDWSPDGRSLVYASYRDDAVELWTIDLASGAARPLTHAGAVSLEPRYSPDGRRIAFVSTAFEGRFHVFTIAAAGDAAPVRLTEDHDSGLPRYYYSRFDHFLSPTWSPDGRELLVVSNRGRIWGTGGLWRLAAGSAPGPLLREVRYEETSWKARPDWSRDGRRVVYASYLGRAWHQLWVMTADGGDVLPLTYGDFDATSPRFTPDGTRIAYVSNEGGDTALVILTLPGGQRHRVDLAEREYKAPRGRLRITVTEAATGKAVPARVSVTGRDGRAFAPDDAWRHADDSFDRAERPFEYGYFHTAGTSELTVPAGVVTVEVVRGLEHRPFRQAVTVEAGKTLAVEAAVARIADLGSRGFVSGDLHVHMNYGGTYRATPATLRFQAEAEDLQVVESLIVNKEQRVPDVSYFTGGLDPVSTAATLVRHDQEFHTTFWGHVGLLGLARHVLLPGYSDYTNTAAASLVPTNADVADLAHAQGALLGYVHPLDWDPVGDRAAEGSLIAGIPVDVALGKVDYYETVGFSDHLASSRFWYRLLNCGFRLPAGAGTDAMTNYASLRGPVGMNRVYVKTGGAVDHRLFLEGLRAGRTMTTNGPLVELALRPRGGAAWSEPGDALALPRGARELEARVSLRSIVPVDRLEVVGNGRVVASVALEGDRTSADAVVRVAAPGSGWFVLRAYAEHSRHPVLDGYPFATTSPVYVDAGGAPVRSREDARFFSEWIARLRAFVERHPGWNSEAEKQAVLGQLAAAREVYERQAGSRP